MKTVLLALILAALIMCAWYFQPDMQKTITSIQHQGVLAPLLFIITYCLATILILPTMVLTLAGGAIFGPFAGVLYNLAGATSGAACSFIISRYLAYNWFEKRRGRRINRIIAGVERRGWQFVAVLRLFPILPFNLVNYGLGVTNISFKIYLLTTFIFLIPAEIVYTYWGYAGIQAITDPKLFYKNTGVVILVVSGLLILVYQFIKRRRLPLKKPQANQ